MCFLKFPVFSLSGKIWKQIPCFPCAVATLLMFFCVDHQHKVRLGCCKISYHAQILYKFHTLYLQYIYLCRIYPWHLGLGIPQGHQASLLLLCSYELSTNSEKIGHRNVN